MYTYESGKRTTNPSDRAHDHLATAAIDGCSPEHIAATVHVLRVMADEAHLEPLLAAMTRDPSGNPVMDTPDQRLAQSTWYDAHNLSERLGDVIYALVHALEDQR